ncbi:MAG: hypothetical protein E6R03_11205 [Hyphomicrobiaceae bacterium]|nr:MAG: hypothetical protein E6R03_11205 [Hyphomicrobiaceae bacterium]
MNFNLSNIERSFFLFIVTVVGLTLGCATRIHLSPAVNCAVQNLKLVGTNSDEMYFSTGGSFYGDIRGHYGGSGWGSGFSFSCRPASSPTEQCQIDAIRNSLDPIKSYNLDLYSKRLKTGFGYALFVIPGIIFKSQYEEEKQLAIAEYDRLKAAALAKCDGQASPLGSR